ncbi:U3 small nucleolar RNA-associated protein 6-domain-containing protein [Morchella snyderi]|nr:U3 small nucleolar RNA-associated protein 6-domain-containing protein [Morchella snyderi]
MADKSRFYLEQSIPELQDLEKKKVFTKEEISAITKKRSEFEHRVNSPAPKPTDYTRYAEYEMNLESLRRKRQARLGINGRTHAGQRRIFFLLDRATRRFPGDLGLWMQYIAYARRERSSKVLARVFASVLKLHPARPELWIFAARHAVEVNADVTEARGHMQRGLRFCKGSRELWWEYAKLELVFVAKVLARRRMLGIDGAPVPAEEQQRQGAGEEEEEETGMDLDGDEIKLPSVSADELSGKPRKDHLVDAAALEDITTNPALNGAVVGAILDAAVKEFPGDMAFVRGFWDLVMGFETLHCRGALLERMVVHVLDVAPTDAEMLMLGVQLPVVGVSVANPMFPARLGTVLDNMREAVGKAVPRGVLYERFATFMVGLLKSALEEEGADEGVRTVMVGTLVKYFKAAEAADEASAELYMLWVETMKTRGKKAAAVEVAERGLRKYKGHKGLQKAIKRIQAQAQEGL